jgi:hypothetical protein
MRTEFAFRVQRSATSHDWGDRTMKSRIVKLLVVLMLAAVMPAAAELRLNRVLMDVGGSNAWVIVEMNFTVGYYNYYSFSGYNELVFPARLPKDQWIIYNFYDYNTGSWENFLYVYMQDRM